MFKAPENFKNLERGKTQVGDSKRYLFGWVLPSKGAAIGTLITDSGDVVQGVVVTN
jgi:hypothetical protein